MSQANDPRSVFETYVRSVNEGDLEAVVDLFADGVSLPAAVQGMYPDEVGRAVVRRYIGEMVIAPNGRLHVERIGVSPDGWVFGDVMLTNDIISAMGHDGIRGIDRLRVIDGQIVDFGFMPDILDPSTLSFYAALGMFDQTTDS